jgi:polysaccharide biosynthesis/export protein
MKGRDCVVLVVAGCLLLPMLVVAVAQEAGTRVAMQSAGTVATTKPGKADGERSPELAGDRHPLYRLCRNDVLEINFTFSPQLNQVVRIQPDGFISLKSAEQVYAAGQTVPELLAAIRAAYSTSLHDPEISIVLKEFDGPHFIATGQVAHPGKYELRGETTVSEALAIAGGFTSQAKHSQVVLFHRNSDHTVQARLLDVKQMMRTRNLEEDVRLQPGDLLFVPQNVISKLGPLLRLPTMGVYWNAAQY